MVFLPMMTIFFVALAKRDCRACKAARNGSNTVLFPPGLLRRSMIRRSTGVVSKKPNTCCVTKLKGGSESVHLLYATYKVRVDSMYVYSN